MSGLPVNWVRTPLDALGQWGSGGTPKRTNPEYYDGGKIPWLIIGDLNDDVVTHSATHITEAGLANSSAKLLPAETLLIAMYGSIGKLGITGFECATNQAIAFCKPDENLTTLRYLFYALMNAKGGLVALGQGGAQQNISQGILKAHEILLAPLNEQKCIADKLDAVLARVDACRDRLDRIPAILKRFRQSVLAAATSGKLTEDWRADQVARMQPQAESGNIARDSAQSHYVVTAAPDSAALHPGYEANTVDWQQTDVQSVAHVGTGSTPLRSNSTFFAPTGTPWITSAATSQTFVTDANEFVTQAAITAHRLKTYPIGTLLVAMYGEGKTRGQVTELGIPATINQACAAIVVNEEKALKSYVKLALQANYFEMRELAEGGNQPNLNLSKIKEFPLPLPGITEQTEIVRRVEALFAFADRLEARHTAARAQVEKLTPSTLAKAFRGELVPQDPNDEPASVLLQRIHAQRNKPQANKPSRSLRKQG